MKRITAVVGGTLEHTKLKHMINKHMSFNHKNPDHKFLHGLNVVGFIERPQPQPPLVGSFTPCPTACPARRHGASVDSL